ncbi:MAG: hypothetical protein ACM3PC_10775 [Deltaproteobacteria bacterium]
MTRQSLLLLVFVVALGEGLRLHSGDQPAAAYAWLALAQLAVGAAVFVPVREDPAGRWAAILAPLSLAALALEAWELAGSRPGWRTRPGAPIHAVISLAAIAAAVLGAAGISGGSRLQRAAPAFICAAFLSAFVYFVYATPDPWIDVHMFHDASFADLLAGRDPYGQLRPNLYPHFPFYAPEILAEGGSRVNVGFPYPPLQLLLALPAHLIAGDYRYGQAMALPLSAALMMLAVPGRAATAAGTLFLMTPSILVAVEGSWTEPTVVLLFSATMFCAVRAPRLLPWALGGLFAVKQYTIALAPLVPLLLRDEERNLRGLRRVLPGALAVAAAVTAPFFLWKPGAFLRDVVLFQVRQPFRLDSFSWLALARLQGWPLPQWLSFAVLGVLLAAAAARAPRSPAGFAAAVALAYCGFFSTAKQAFSNYYLYALAAGAWALALAGTDRPAAAAQSAQTVNHGA